MTVRGAVLVVVLVLIGPAALRAAPAAAPAVTDTSEREARELFKRAELNFNLSRFAEALADYQAAYQAKPLPGFLFNIAQCYRNMAQFERARFFYRRYLVLDPRTSNRHQVEDLIAEMTRQLEKQEAANAATASATTPPPAAPEPAVPPAAITTAPAPASSAADSGQVPLLTAQSTPPPASTPVYKRWWFWTGIGAVIVGGAVTAFILTRDDNVPNGSLEPINGRP